jgi:hypothetical protein
MLSRAHHDALAVVSGALAPMDPEPEDLRPALSSARAAGAGTGPRWAVSGSVALALHGLPVECRDLDVLTRAEYALLAASRIPGTTLEAVRFRARERLRGHLGRIAVGGVDTEILGGVQNQLPDGSWTPPARLAAREIVHIDVDGCRCNVLSLPALRAVYELMKRPETLALIDQAG